MENRRGDQQQQQLAPDRFDKPSGSPTLRVGIFKNSADPESKQTSKRRTKPRSKVWEKVAWFTRRSKSGKEGKSTPESTRKENENYLSVGELSVASADSSTGKLKNKNSVRKTRSFYNLKRRKERELTEGINSKLHEGKTERRHIEEYDTATGTFHDFTADRRVPSKTRTASSNSVLSEIAREMNCPFKESTKDNMQSDHYKSSLTTSDIDPSKVSLRCTLDPALACSKEMRSSNLKPIVSRNKSFSGPIYNSWPRKKRAHLGISPKDHALSPPVKQKRLGHGVALKKTATFSGFDSSRLITNEHPKFKRICKSTPYLLETNHIQNQSGFQIGVIHFYKSPNSGPETNDKAMTEKEGDSCRRKFEKTDEKKDCDSEIDTPHLHQEGQLFDNNKGTLQQCMENLHMNDKELFLQSVTKPGNVAVPREQILCDILDTPAVPKEEILCDILDTPLSELCYHGDEHILNNAESTVGNGDQLKIDDKNSSDGKSESCFADETNNSIRVAEEDPKHVNGILTMCSAIKQDFCLACLSDSSDFKQSKNEHNCVQSLSRDKSTWPILTSESQETLSPSKRQVFQNADHIFSDKLNGGAFAKQNDSGCEIHVTCEELKKQVLSDEVFAEMKISNTCLYSQGNFLPQEYPLDTRLHTDDIRNQGNLQECITSNDNLQGDYQLWNDQFINQQTALCADSLLFNGNSTSDVTGNALVCVEAGNYSAKSDVAVNRSLRISTTSLAESNISEVQEGLEGQGCLDENELPSLTFYKKGKKREEEEFVGNKLIPPIVCTHIDSAIDRTSNTASIFAETLKSSWSDTHISETANDDSNFDNRTCERSESISNLSVGDNVESDSSSSIESKCSSVHLSLCDLSCTNSSSNRVETSKPVWSDIQTSETEIDITGFEDKSCESNLTASVSSHGQQKDYLHTSVMQGGGCHMESESTSSIESKCSSIGLSLCDSSNTDSGVECNNGTIDSGTDFEVASHSVSNTHEHHRQKLQFNQGMDSNQLDCISCNTDKANVSKKILLPRPTPPKVEGSVFKQQVEEILHCFDEFNHEQRNIMLRRILEHCELPQMHMLSVAMEPLLHKSCPPNCQDMMAWLPYNVTFCVMSLLDPVSLCRCSRVNRHWNTLASDPVLWQQLCRYKNWELSRLGEQKQTARCIAPDGSIEWKKMFAERFLLRQNWLNGKCKVRTFEGHAQGISCVQFDDSRIVSGSSDKTIKVWDIHSGDPNAVLTLAGHSGTVRCLNLNGNRLVSGSTDRSIKVWDLSFESYWSGASCKVTMVGHMHTVRCLQVDDEKVVSGSYDKTLKVWDIKTGQCRLTLRGHNAAVLCVQFDEKKIVSGSYDKTIKVWSLAEGSCLMTLTGHHDAVTCLNLTFDGRKVISGSLDHNLKFWDLFTGKCIGTLDWIRSEGHTGVVRCLQADSWRIVSAGDDKTLKVWCLETGQRLLTLRWHTDGVTCLHFNDHRIVSGSYDKTVKLWDFTPVHGFLDPKNDK